MRKYLLAVFALFVCVGLLVAKEVSVVKYDAGKKELTVKEDGNEKTYKIGDKTKVMRGEKEGDLEKTLKGWEQKGEKLSNYKIDITTLRRLEQERTFGMNDIGRVQLRTTVPLSYDSYRRNRLTGSLILIDEHTNETVGAAMIL